MTLIWWLLGGSGLAVGGLGLAFVMGGLPAVIALVRGVMAWAMKLLKYFGDGLFLIGKHPVAMFACACLCLAACVGGIWMGLAWTKHVREAARGTVANVEAAYTREDHADKALAAAAVQAGKAAAAAEHKRQAEEAKLAAAAAPAVTDPAVPAGVREPAKPARKARRVRECEKSLFGCL
jgi:hypothetical protein